MKLFEFLGYYNYWVFAVLLMIGFYAVIAKANLIKKLIGLSLFQSAVFLMYISMTRSKAAPHRLLSQTPSTNSIPTHCRRY